MKRIFIASAVIFFITSANAQTANVSPGKKIQLTSINNINITMSVMGNDMDIKNESTNQIEFELKSIDGKKVTFIATRKLTKIKSSSPMGEQEFSSDDSSLASNPLVAEAFKNINKPETVSGELGKPLAMTDDAMAGKNLDVMVLFLFNPFNAEAKEGSNFSDSTTTEDGSKFVNNYTVTKHTKEEITVAVSSTNTILGTKQQGPVEVKMNMKGASTEIRIYDAVTGLLKTETTSFSMGGTTEAQGMTMPMTGKGTGTIIVK